MKLKFELLSCAVLLAIATADAATNTSVLAPSGYVGIEGDSAVSPLSGQLPTHFQQVYTASEFLGRLPQGGGYIIDLVFRTDGPLGNNFSTILSNVQISLSTTLRAPDNLSPIFAANVGGDATVVVGPGPLSLSGSHGVFIGQPEPLSVNIFLTTPFLYDPSAGNLLLDIVTFGNNSGVSALDAVNVNGDSVSIVSSFTGNLTSGQTDSRGLVTYFAITPIPEPEALVLVPTFGALWLFTRRRKTQNN